MILIINTCDKKLSKYEFINPITSILNQYEVKHFTEKYNPNDYDGIIISGTALKDNKALDFISSFSWINNYSKPIFGICIGMQIIAVQLGAKVINSSKIGVTEINKKGKDIFSNIKKVYELHNYSVTLPKGAEPLLYSDKRILAFKKNKIYATIFHPEVYNKDIIIEFQNFCLKQ